MKLKKYRQSIHKTQQQIADYLGVPLRTYQNYEREVREADSDILCRLADLYDITLDELVGRVDGDVRKMQNELLDIFDELGDSDRQLLLAIARTIGGDQS